jgi:hypothetical protein
MVLSYDKINYVTCTAILKSNQDSDLEVNAKDIYTFTSHNNARQNCNRKTTNPLGPLSGQGEPGMWGRGAHIPGILIDE